MSLFVRKYARWLVLPLILVLTGSANLLCLSVDNDDDDDTGLLPKATHPGSRPLRC